MSKRSSIDEGYPSLSSYLPRIPKVEDHLPKMPTLLELAEAPPPSAGKSRSRGLFDDLLQARPEVLLQDALEHPGAYEEDVVELLKRMTENRHLIDQLSQEEAEKLNLATAEFYSSSPGKPPVLPRKPKKVVMEAVESPTEEPIDIPTQDAFWWT